MGKETFSCARCGGDFIAYMSDVKREKRLFCSKSCAKKKISGSPLTQKRLKELLIYDERNGLFRWLVSMNNAVMAGEIAGSPIPPKMHWRISVDGKAYSAHRLAWLYIYGEWPEKSLDHANGNTGDNRISNLREATNSQNTANSKMRSDNKSGFKGVHYHPATGKWRARIYCNKKAISLGLFDTPREAGEAYRVASLQVFEEFSFYARPECGPQ